VRNKTKRLILHITGFGLLLCLVPLGMTFGRPAVVMDCIFALACFVAAGLIQSETHPDGSAQPAQPHACPYRVEFDDLEVRVIYKGELHERVTWSALMAVGIRIDESFLPAPWWYLFGTAQSGCVYPGEALGAREVLREMQVRLPDFDNVAVIEAMGLMAGGRVIWSAPGADAAQPTVAADRA
jgi:hypothetical protein